MIDKTACRNHVFELLIAANEPQLAAKNSLENAVLQLLDLIITCHNSLCVLHDMHTVSVGNRYPKK